jgi:prepilin-type N-terminal cleavage/methylation domain-containing protein
MSSRSSNQENGFTLIELVIAIAISGILIGAIGTAFITSLRGTATAHDRFVASNGAHTLSTYFTTDVQSTNPDMVSTDPAATLGCASEPPSTTRNVLRLRWSEQTTATDVTAFSVSYRTKWIDDGDAIQGPTSEYSGTSTDQYQLVRYSCSDTDPGTTSTDVATIVGDAPLADHVVVSELDQPVSPTQTAAAVSGQNITLTAYAALGKSETTPYSYGFKAAMRTPDPVPHVSSVARVGTSPTNASAIAWTVTFSEAVSGVDTADFSLVSTGSMSGGSVTTVVGAGTTYTVTANPGTGQGTSTLKVEDNDTIVSTLDPDKLGGTGNDNGDFVGVSYTVDRVAPTLTVALASTQAATTSTLPISFTVTFNESVTDFDDATDITNAGTAPGATFSISGSGKDYTVSASVTGDGTVQPRVEAAAAIDAAGNTTSLTTSSAIVTYSTSGPTVTITNVQLENQNNAAGIGTLEKDDTVTITFSDSMKVDTFCSTWSGATPSLTANDLVEVTVTDGGSGNDVLTVSTTSGCTFNLGSINLGSAGWVSGTSTYGGNGGGASEIAYNDSTQQLTITIGDKNSGPSAPGAAVADVTPTYTSHSNIRSSTLGTISNSPYTATSGSRF